MMARLVAAPEQSGVYEWLRACGRAADGPVNVPVWALPPWVRVEYRWWRRAVVGEDDSIQFVDDDGRLWLAENGL